MSLSASRSSLPDPTGPWPTPEDRVRLLELESTFLRSCLSVRSHGAELHLLRAQLLQELLDLEAEKRRSSDRDSDERLEKLQALKEQQTQELSRLRERLQRHVEAAVHRSEADTTRPSETAVAAAASEGRGRNESTQINMVTTTAVELDGSKHIPVPNATSLRGSETVATKPRGRKRGRAKRSVGKVRQKHPATPDSSDPPPKKKRGRPPKQPAAPPPMVDTTPAPPQASPPPTATSPPPVTDNTQPPLEVELSSPPVKKQGRPRKKTASVQPKGKMRKKRWGRAVQKTAAPAAVVVSDESAVVSRESESDVVRTLSPPATVPLGTKRPRKVQVGGSKRRKMAADKQKKASQEEEPASDDLQLANDDVTLAAVEDDQASDSSPKVKEKDANSASVADANSDNSGEPTASTDEATTPPSEGDGVTKACHIKRKVRTKRSRVELLTAPKETAAPSIGVEEAVPKMAVVERSLSPEIPLQNSSSFPSSLPLPLPAPDHLRRNSSSSHTPPGKSLEEVCNKLAENKKKKSLSSSQAEASSAGSTDQNSKSKTGSHDPPVADGPAVHPGGRKMRKLAKQREINRSLAYLSIVDTEDGGGGGGARGVARRRGQLKVHTLGLVPPKLRTSSDSL